MNHASVTLHCLIVSQVPVHQRPCLAAGVPAPRPHPHPHSLWLAVEFASPSLHSSLHLPCSPAISIATLDDFALQDILYVFLLPAPSLLHSKL